MKPLLTIREVAELLQINERTALRLAHAGSLPALRVGGQWRVHPVELERWFMDARREGKTPGEPSLEFFSEERILLNHPAGTVEEVLRAVAEALASQGHLMYPDLYAAALLERESMMSTGLGEGVAIPHARHAVNGLFRSPLCLFLRLQEPVDFRAVDGRPVDLVFALAAPTNETHLESLAHLLRIAREPESRSALRAAETAGEALTVLTAGCSTPN